MENNKPKSDEKQESEERPHEQIVRPVLSQREIRSIVKDFAIAYIEGQIKIHFPTPEELMEYARKEGSPMDYKTAATRETDTKADFRNQIAICLGSKKATSEELERAISQLFEYILACRNGGRIEGVFSEYGLESRIKELEEGLDKVNNLVEEIVEYFTGLPSTNGGSDHRPVP